MNPLNHESLLVIKKQIECLTYVYQVTSKYPKTEKFSLVTQIKQQHLKIYEILVKTKREKKLETKHDLLTETLVHIDIIYFYIRFSYTQKYITKNNYETWSTKIVEIHKMINGWIKNAKKSESYI